MLVCAVLIAFICSPNKYIGAYTNGLNVWALKLVPTLLPFMILTKLMIYTGVPDILGNKLSRFTSKLYGAPGCSGYVYILSVLSGYPMGAKMLGDLYKDKKITKSQAHSICSFTSTSGPLFIYVTVGVGMFASIKIGICVLIAHILGALINGLIYRNKDTQIDVQARNTHYDLSSTITDSIQSILIIGVYVCIFFVLIEMLNNLSIYSSAIDTISKIFNIQSQLLTSLINGSIELTRGCLDLSTIGLTTHQNIIYLTAIISFGSISTLMQSFSFINTFDMSLKKMLLMKITQCACSVFVSLVLCLLV